MSILFFSCPLTEKSIFYSPHGECRFYFSHAPSRRNRCSIRLTADVVLLLFRLLAAIFHSRLTALINFFFGSRQEPISFRLHGDLRLTAVINVLFAFRRDSISFRLGNLRLDFFLFLMVILCASPGDIIIYSASPRHPMGFSATNGLLHLF